MPLPQWIVLSKKLAEGTVRAPREQAADDPGVNQTPFWENKFPKDKPVEPSVVHAFLNPWGQDAGKSNSFNEEPRYVILGNGFVATVNHATLLQTQWGRERIAGRKILHIGYPDPWTIYHPHNMNQFLELLILPGYKNQAGDGDIKVPRWLWSANFAAKTAAEIAEIKKVPGRNEPEVIPGQVVKIEKVGNNYSLTLHGTDKKVIASHIDICSGPGQTRCIPSKDLPAPKDLTEQYEKPPALAKSTPLQLITATNFTWENAAVVAGGLMLVIGNGPAAAQAVERALEPGGSSEILWSPSDLNGAFPPTLRLDWLVKQRGGAGLPIRLGFPKGKLLPTPSKLWITESEYAISRIDYLDETLIQSLGLKDGKGAALSLKSFPDVGVKPLLVTFKPATKGPNDNAIDHACLDCNGDPTPQFYYGVFHQIVIAKGVQDTVNETGSTFAVIQNLLTSGTVSLEPIQCYGGPVAAIGLQSTDKRIRILGAAAHGNKIFKSLAGSWGTKLVEFESTLPAQARIAQQGVTLSALTTACANEYYGSATTKTNPSINTAAFNDMIMNAGTSGYDLLNARAFRIAPFSDYKSMLGGLIVYLRNKSLLTSLPAPSRQTDEEARKFAEFVSVFNSDDELRALTDRLTEKDYEDVFVFGFVRERLQTCKFKYQPGDYSQ